MSMTIKNGIETFFSQKEESRERQRKFWKIIKPCDYETFESNETAPGIRMRKIEGNKKVFMLLKNLKTHFSSTFGMKLIGKLTFLQPRPHSSGVKKFCVR